MSRLRKRIYKRFSLESTRGHRKVQNAFEMIMANGRVGPPRQTAPSSNNEYKEFEHGQLLI